ncbi:hypothetical protein LguiB_030452 [Lonicera macranthoides]
MFDHQRSTVPSLRWRQNTRTRFPSSHKSLEARTRPLSGSNLSTEGDQRYSKSKKNPMIASERQRKSKKQSAVITLKEYDKRRKSLAPPPSEVV